MDFERFKEFMLESAARHDTEIAAIRESLKSVADTLQSINDSFKSVTSTVDRLVDNQVFLQESHAQTQESLRELERIVFRHVTDPDAHSVN
jgi:hypothetical protein